MKKPKKKKIISHLFLIFIYLLTIEVAVRIYFAIRVGPDILLYGIPTASNLLYKKEQKQNKDLLETHSVMIHNNILDGYSKYYPEQKRTEKDVQGKIFTIKMNNHGFRGKDFFIQKKPNHLRILTLGASSTFGYKDRDNETYPYYLEHLLNDQYPGVKRFEVINLGVPHLKAKEIYHLFKAEGLRLNPDIVTFYEGINDSTGLIQRSNFFIQLHHKLLKKSLALKFAHSLSNTLWGEYSQEYFTENLKGRSEGFLEYLSRINNLCKENNVIFIVANQQVTSLQGEERQKLKKLSYEQETKTIETKLFQKKIKLNEHELYFLTHSILMKNLKNFVKKNHIIFIDMIQTLDGHRDYLATGVHLTPEGNQIIAKKFTEIILNLLEKNLDASLLSENP